MMNDSVQFGRWPPEVVLVMRRDITCPGPRTQRPHVVTTVPNWLTWDWLKYQPDSTRTVRFLTLSIRVRLVYNPSYLD